MTRPWNRANNRDFGLNSSLWALLGPLWAHFGPCKHFKLIFIFLVFSFFCLISTHIFRIFIFSIMVAFLLFTCVYFRRLRILIHSVRFPPFGYAMKEIRFNFVYRMQFLHKDIFGKMWCMTICSNEELHATIWFQCRLLIMTFVINYRTRCEVVFFIFQFET